VSREATVLVLFQWFEHYHEASIRGAKPPGLYRPDPRRHRTDVLAVQGAIAELHNGRAQAEGTIWQEARTDRRDGSLRGHRVIVASLSVSAYRRIPCYRRRVLRVSLSHIAHIETANINGLQKMDFKPLSRPIADSKLMVSLPRKEAKAMIRSDLYRLSRIAAVVFGLTAVVHLSDAQAQWRGGGHGGGWGWHGGGGWGWHGGGGWGWRGGGWGWGGGWCCSFAFGFYAPPAYYAPPPYYYYPPPAYYPPPGYYAPPAAYPPSGYYPSSPYYPPSSGHYGYGAATGYPSYGAGAAVDPNNCGTPDEPKACPHG
jgi:hypothetical protein